MKKNGGEVFPPVVMNTNILGRICINMVPLDARLPYPILVNGKIISDL